MYWTDIWLYSTKQPTPWWLVTMKFPCMTSIFPEFETSFCRKKLKNACKSEAAGFCGCQGCPHHHPHRPHHQNVHNRLNLMTILLSDASPHLCQWQSLQGSWQERCFFSDFSHYHHCQCHSHCPDPPKNHCSEKITAKVAVVTASTEGIG